MINLKAGAKFLPITYLKMCHLLRNGLKISITILRKPLFYLYSQRFVEKETYILSHNIVKCFNVLILK